MTKELVKEVAFEVEGLTVVLETNELRFYEDGPNVLVENKSSGAKFRLRPDGEEVLITTPFGEFQYQDVYNATNMRVLKRWSR